MKTKGEKYSGIQSETLLNASSYGLAGFAGQILSSVHKGNFSPVDQNEI